jgi:type IV secretory pathway component VirB8
MDLYFDEYVKDKENLSQGDFDDIYHTISLLANHKNWMEYINDPNTQTKLDEVNSSENERDHNAVKSNLEKQSKINQITEEVRLIAQ